MREQSPSTETDRLIARARGGDLEAFDLLIARHRERLEALIYLCLGPARRRQVTPDDVLLQVKRRALLSLQQFNGTGDGTFFRWMGAIAEDVVQCAESPPAMGDPRAAEETSPAQPAPRSPWGTPVRQGLEPKHERGGLARCERLERLEEALGKISPPHAKVIYNAAVRKLTVPEIASRLGVAPDTVGPLLLSALRELKVQFPIGLKPEWLRFMPEEEWEPLPPHEVMGMADPPARPRGRAPPADPTTPLSVLLDLAAEDFSRIWRRAVDDWSSHTHLLDELETLDSIDLIVTDDEELPRRFGDFERGPRLGGGGMGVVFKARQVSLDRLVALKLLRPDLFSDARAVARFIREAKAAAIINHPNVVKVLAMGTEDGVPFYAMELSPGRTLQRLLHEAMEKRLPLHAARKANAIRLPAWLLPRRLREPLPEPFTLPPPAAGGSEGKASSALGPYARLAQAFAGAAEGLQQAHEQEIVHRDLKPSNLILDAAGRLCIIDFGVAQVQDRLRLTQPDEQPGTPLYMSPEQAQTPPGPVDLRSDIYSLGVTLYEALVLRLPHDARNDLRELRDKILHQDPLPPRRLDRRIPIDLETIVLECLRKDPRQRYQTAQDLADDLSRFVRGEPVVARPRPPIERAARAVWQNRRRILKTAAMVAVLLAVSLPVFMVIMAGQEKRRSEHETTVRAAVRSLLGRDLFRMETRLALPGGEQRVLVPRDRKRSISSRIDDGSSRVFQRGSRLLEAGLLVPSAGVDPAKRAEDLLLGSMKGFSKDAAALYYLARSQRLQGKRADAEASLARALRVHPNFIPALAFRASLLEERRDPRAEAAIRDLEKALAASSDEWPRVWLEAQRAVEAQRWKDAAAAFVRLKGLTEKSEPYLGCQIETLVGAGVSLLRAGNTHEAVAVFGAGVERWPDWLEPTLFLGKADYLDGHPSTAEKRFLAFAGGEDAHSKDRLGGVAAAVTAVYLDLGARDRAVEWLTRIPDKPEARLLRSEMLARLGKCSEAVALARSVLAAPDDVPARLTVVNALLLEKEIQQAEAELDRIPESLRSDPRVVIARGLCREGLNDLQGAERCFREASCGGSVGATAHYNLGRTLAQRQMYEEAIAAYEKSLSLDRGNALAHLNLGAVLDMLKRPYDAQRQYTVAVELDPRLPEAHANLAWALHRQRRYAEAALHYRAAAELGLRDAVVVGNFASCLHRKDSPDFEDREEAIKQYGMAIRLDDKYATPRFDLGSLLIDLKRHAEATIPLEAYLKLEPDDPDGYTTLAMALAPLRRRPEAVALHRRAIGLCVRPDQLAYACNRLSLCLVDDLNAIPEALEELVAETAVLEEVTTSGRADETLRRVLPLYRRAIPLPWASCATAADRIDGPRVLLPWRSGYRTLRGRSEPPPGWMLADFDDGSWDSLPAPLGFPARKGLETVIDDMMGSFTSLYLRIPFEVPEGTVGDKIRCLGQVNGGFTAYLNGKEVHREHVSWDATPAASTTAKEDDGGIRLVKFVLEAKHFVPGKNVLAIQLSSSGLSDESLFFDATVIVNDPPPRSESIERAAALLESLRGYPEEVHSLALVPYLEGRLAEMAGDRNTAWERYHLAVKADGAQAEPFLRLAAASEEVREAEEAEAVLRGALASELRRSEAAWRAWWDLVHGKLGLGPKEALRRFPRSDDLDVDELKCFPADLHWLIQEMCAGHPIRINCGGQNLALRDAEWARDRFFVGGIDAYLSLLDEVFRDQDDAGLYLTERYFEEGGPSITAYRVPLLRGKYRVTLHFAEGWHTERDERVFDVLLEGITLKECFEPLEAGFGVPVKLSSDVTVDDGTLEIGFRKRRGNPKISAFEIERIGGE
jgi:serine/threonine protein kinase/Flp pilus assembly protein TadD/DNA-directed RNA polymerase specialized sigma24 family protein